MIAEALKQCAYLKILIECAHIIEAALKQAHRIFPCAVGIQVYYLQDIKRSCKAGEGQQEIMADETNVIWHLPLVAADK